MHRNAPLLPFNPTLTVAPSGQPPEATRSVCLPGVTLKATTRCGGVESRATETKASSSETTSSPSSRPRGLRRFGGSDKMSRHVFHANARHSIAILPSITTEIPCPYRFSIRNSAAESDICMRATPAYGPPLNCAVHLHHVRRPDNALL